MFGLFRRNKTHSITGVSSFAMSLLSVAQHLKPMKNVEFEMANQSLEDVFEWLAEQEASNWLNGGHYLLNDQSIARYQLHLSRYLGAHTLPVVFSNCSESILHALPMLNMANQDLGIVHIGNQFEVKASLEPEIGSAFHFSLARFNETRLFCLGIDRDNQSDKVMEYAEDLGCDWMTLNECQFSHRFQVKQQLASYLAHCDQIVLNIDLASLAPKSRLESSRCIDVQLVNRIIRQALVSGKVKMIQLVGWKDKHIFAKSTLSILHEIASMVPSSDRAA